MASTFRTWVSALRLRTLPLALSGVLAGAFIADLYTHADMAILLLSALTAVSLQVLSNLANDYGDYTKGTDNDNRLGNMRALQSGVIRPGQMRIAIGVAVAACLASGIALLLEASGGNVNYFFLAFLLLGMAAIAAAIKYTVGKRAYGYSGWGDLFVFLFFGPVAVLGSFLLHSHFAFELHDHWPALLPAFAIGLLCTGVLNTNNIRDIVNDEASGKRTIPVQIGLRAARRYHLLLIAGACCSMLAFLLTAPLSPLAWTTCLAFVPLGLQAAKVYASEPSPAFNGLLKQLSLGTLLLVLLLVVSEMINSWLQLFTLIDNR